MEDNHMKPNSVASIQFGGDHYNGMKIEPVEYIEANGIGFVEGNAIKYLSRHKLNGGEDDDGTGTCGDCGW